MRASHRSEISDAYFQGAMTNITPNGVLLMNRRNPGLSVSVKGTSARASEAIDSMYPARSKKPFISAWICEIGRPICKVSSRERLGSEDWAKDLNSS